MDIQKNLIQVKENIKKACEKANRSVQDVQLIAVTKTRAIDEINAVIELGATHIGENKVQEIMEKYDHIHSATWHMIGHLQKNKVKYIINKVDLIHSVDTIGLMAEIDKKASQINKIMDVLVQVNVANDENKFGIQINEIDEFMKSAEAYENIRIKGFMAIVPYFEDGEEARVYFKKMKTIFDEQKNKACGNTDIEFLSMGMTNDYQIAIEEGSNLVRVGTGIFGERNYSK